MERTQVRFEDQFTRAILTYLRCRYACVFPIVISSIYRKNDDDSAKSTGLYEYLSQFHESWWQLCGYCSWLSDPCTSCTGTFTKIGRSPLSMWCSQAYALQGCGELRESLPSTAPDKNRTTPRRLEPHYHSAGEP